MLSAGEPADLIWHHAESVALAAKSDTQIDLAITLSDGQLASVHIERSGPGRFVATLSPKVRSERPVAYLRLRPRVDTSEAFYGLGGFADEVNHRGKVRPMQQEVDVLESKSRVKDHITNDVQRRAGSSLLRLEAAYREKEDLIMVGAYQKGSDPYVDAAIQYRERALDFLRQRPDETSHYGDTYVALAKIAESIDAAVVRR